MKAFAASQNFSPKVKDIKERIKQNREKFENRRTATSKRLQGDVGRIAKEEIEFSKSLLRQMIPVEIKVNVDKNAEGIKKIIPISFHILDVEEWGNSGVNTNTATNTTSTANTKEEAEKHVVESSVDAYLVDGEADTD